MIVTRRPLVGIDRIGEPQDLSNPKETVEEFLARGGKVEKVPYGKVTDERLGREKETGLSLKVLRNIRINRRKK